MTSTVILGLSGGARPTSQTALAAAADALGTAPDQVRFAGYGTNGDLGYDPPAGTRIAVYETLDPTVTATTTANVAPVLRPAHVHR